MKLWRLLVVKVVTYGIPALITYPIYRLSSPWINHDDPVALIIIFTLILIYTSVWLANIAVFEDTYKEYLRN